MARGLVLPGSLVSILSDLGYLWPDADEVRLTQLGGVWVSLQSKLDELVGQAQTLASSVMENNKGDDVDAFKAAWEEAENPLDTLGKDATGTPIVGAVTIMCALVVLLLKIWVIVQLILLAIAIAQAITTAAITFGASLLEIPVFKEIFGRIINLLISQALQAIL